MARNIPATLTLDDTIDIKTLMELSIENAYDQVIWQMRVDLLVIRPAALTNQQIMRANWQSITRWHTEYVIFNV